MLVGNSRTMVCSIRTVWTTSGAGRHKTCRGMNSTRPAAGNLTFASSGWTSSGAGDDSLRAARSWGQGMGESGQGAQERGWAHPVPGERKSGIPADTEMPAPAITTTFRQSFR